MDAREYVYTTGYVGAMGKMWKPCTGCELEEKLNMAAEKNGMSREKLESLLNDGRGAAAKTGEQSPNYYYDHSMAMIRAANVPKKQVEMKKCDCGCTIPKMSVMSASMGSSCPDCYDRMS